RPAAVLDRRGPVGVQPGDRGEIAAGEERFESTQERRVDRQRVGEEAVRRTFLLDDDLAVALENVRVDLAVVLVDQRLDRLFAGKDSGAGLANALRSKR